MTSDWEEHINKLIGLFHTWEGLLVAVGHTIYDVFSKSAGLGTTLVSTITGMLNRLDEWLESTTGSASVRTLFAVHLQMIEAILNLLPALLSGVGRVYLVLAPALTEIATALADAAGWALKIPVAGPLLAFAAAIAIFANKMKLLTIGSWLIDLAKLSKAFLALSTSEGLASGIKGLPGLFSSIFGSAGQGSAQAVFKSSVTEFAAAVAKFAGTSVTSSVTNTGEDAAAGGGLLGGLEVAAVVAAAAVILGMDYSLITNKGKGTDVLDTSNAARQSGPGAARFGEPIATNENTILGQLIAMGELADQCGTRRRIDLGSIRDVREIHATAVEGARSEPRYHRDVVLGNCVEQRSERRSMEHVNGCREEWPRQRRGQPHTVGRCAGEGWRLG